MSEKNESSKHFKVSPDDLDRRAPLARVASLKTPPIDFSDRDLSEKELSSLLTEVQMTVRFRYTILTRRDIMNLLLTLNYQAVHFGVSLWLYLVLEHCITYLVGSKSSPYEIKDEKERLTSSVALLILRDLEKGSWNYGGRNQLQAQTKQDLLETEGLIISKRQYGSIKSHHRPEKYIEVRTVPLESSILQRNSNSTRYDSYCRGYGESSGFALNKLRTRQSTELDGETKDIPLSFSLKNISKYFQLNLIDLLRGKNKKRIL
jgi:hypothetical protein